MDLSTNTDAGLRNRSAIKIVCGLVGVGAVIGLLIGLMGATALRAIGLKPIDGPVVTASSAPATTPAPTPAPTTTTPPAEPPKTPRQIALRAQPAKASPGERITLSGRFPRLDSGAVLQVQRKGKGQSWQDFPVTAQTKNNGTFSTWVQTSRQGTMQFRVVNRQADVKTPPVTVRIG